MSSFDPKPRPAVSSGVQPKSSLSPGGPGGSRQGWIPATTPEGQQQLWGLLTIGPALFLILALTLYPVAYSLWLSLLEKHSFFPQEKFIGLETIVGFRDIAQTGAVAHQLECFGFIALAHGQLDRALQLLAAASSLREKGGTPMTPDEQPYFDEQIKQIHERMDRPHFQSVWSKGRAMKMEQAIDLALELSMEVVNE